MLFTFQTTLIVYCTKKIHETYWCSSSIAYQEKGTDWILRIFTSNDKNPVYLPIISILQFFWGSEWSRSNPISHKTIRHIPNIKNNEFKIKKNAIFFQTHFYFSFIFLRQYFTSILRSIPLPQLSVLFASIWHSFLAQASLLLPSRHTTSFQRL